MRWYAQVADWWPVNAEAYSDSHHLYNHSTHVKFNGTIAEITAPDKERLSLSMKQFSD